MADRGIVYGDVGLLAEARSAIASAIAVLRETGNRSDLAEVLLLAAELDAGDDRAEAAVRFAEEAAALFDRTGRARLALRAELTKLEGLAAVAVEPTEVAGRAIEVGDRLARSSWRSDAATAYAVAAWVARRSDPELVALAKRRYDRLRPQAGGREAIRVSAAMAAAALELGDRRRSRRWVTAGLAAAVERGHSLGAADMRSGLFASRFVGELAWVGIELAISDGRAREALSRSESVRLAAHVPPSREGDHVLSDLLTELRRVRSEARSVEDHASLAVLDTERRSLEDRIRSTARERVPTTAVSARSLGERLRSESATTFIELVEHGADVVVIQADSKHVRLRGRFGSARLRSDLESLGFAVQRLHRTATSRASRAASYELLQQTAEDIERSVFGSDHSLKTDRLVIVPGGAACDVAWNSLPISREHVVSISPAIVTLRPRERDINDGSLVAISGPGLVHSADEVRRIADIANGRVLAGPQAVTGAVLNALSEARVCHLACHGKFRGDNPLFSALDLHDGPLTVYDLEQCDRVPEVVVLSACDVGRADAAGGSVLLGFATALLDLGVRWVVAPLTPVNDERSVALMVRLHEHLAAGVDAATALHSASVHSDGSLDPTAAPFLCFGS
ncbi:MAG: CHAT domain-containing protein [Actinomycetota bacterium]